MLNKLKLPVLALAGLLAVFSPSVVFAQHGAGNRGGGGGARGFSGGGNRGGQSFQGGGGRSFNGGGGRSYNGGGAQNFSSHGFNFGNGSAGRNEFRSGGREFRGGNAFRGGTRFYGGRGYSFGFYGAPYYGYYPGYYGYTDPCGYYDAWGVWRPNPACYGDPYSYGYGY
jgi:hypothetical protein